MDHTLEIPLFPLGTVLFPAGLLPLRIFEPRYVEMTRACIRDNSVFGVTLIRAGYEVGKPAVPCDIGCTARIVEWQEPEPDRFMLLAQGESVFRILRRRTTDSGLIVGRVELREPADPAPLPERHERLAQLLQELIEQIGQEHFPRPSRFDDAAWVGNRLCELLPVEPERKQKLLETADPLAVLDEVERLMQQLRQDGDGAE
jgi:Lon protease-like protein